MSRKSNKCNKRERKDHVFVKPHKRKVHLGDEVWSYLIRGSAVNIRDPKGKSHSIDWSTFTGWSWDGIERICWKGYGLSIKPSHVKDWIENQIIKGLNPDYNKFDFASRPSWAL